MESTITRHLLRLLVANFEKHILRHHLVPDTSIVLELLAATRQAQCQVYYCLTPSNRFAEREREPDRGWKGSEHESFLTLEEPSTRRDVMDAKVSH